MTTQVECFPNELWLSIFSYLEAHDLFYAFGSLNHRFNQLLASSYLRFYVKLTKQNNHGDRYATNLTLWLDRILKRIICLTLIAQSGYEDIQEYLHNNARKLIRLQSLRITINKHQTYIICRILRKLPSLEYLSITCTKRLFLIESILNLPTLRVLQLNLKKSIWYNWYPSEVNNNIEIFYINFQGLSDYRLTNLLLTKMLNLKQFKISGEKYNCVNLEKLFAHPVSNLPALRSIKFVGGSEYLLSNYMKYLQTAMPSLRRLHMDIFCYFMDEKLFDYLVYHWWPVLEKIENIYIKIKGHISGDFPTRTDYFWKILLAKKNQSNNWFRIRWKSYLAILSLVKLTIERNKTKKNR